MSSCNASAAVVAVADEDDNAQIPNSTSTSPRCHTMQWNEVCVKGTTPSIKNHTITFANNKLYVFGGYDGLRNHSSVHTLNPVTRQWQSHVDVKGPVPEGRNGHTATLARGKIWIIGGWLGSGPLASSDVHTLKLPDETDPSLRWSFVPTTGCMPGPCNMHTTDFVEHRGELFVFRGGDGEAYLNDLHSLDITTCEWKVPETSGSPPLPRANHSSAMMGTNLYIFGGWDGQKRLNDMYTLDTTTLTWSKLSPRGTLPSPRAGMTLTPVNGNLYLFGGSGLHAKCYNDLQVYDPQRNLWLNIVVDEALAAGIISRSPNNKFEGRCSGTRMNGDGSIATSSESIGKSSACSCPRGQHQCRRALQGNPNSSEIIHMNADVWVSGRGPGRRAGHTATVVDGGRKMIVFGGSLSLDYLNDVHELDTDPPPIITLSALPSPQLLQRDLVNFLNTEEFSDVTFMVEGKPVYAHRVVLSLLSEHFRALFGAGYKESQAREVVIADMRHDVFLMILEYLYTGQIPLVLRDALCLPKIEYDTPRNVGDEMHRRMHNNNARRREIQTRETAERVPGVRIGSEGEELTGWWEMNYEQLMLAQQEKTETTVIVATDKSNGSINGSICQSDSEVNGEVIDVYGDAMGLTLELLHSADEFMIDNLKQVCELVLQKAVNVDTVDLLFEHADSANAAQLRAVCQHFRRNYGEPDLGLSALSLNE